MGDIVRTLRKLSVKNRRALMLAGFSIFLAGMALSLYSVRDQDISLSIIHCILIAALITPLTILVSSVQLTILASSIKNPISLPGSAQITLAAMASNMLPIPGAIMIKTVAIAKTPADLKRSALINGVSAVQWIGASMLVLGVMGESLIPIAPRMAMLIAAALLIAACLYIWLRDQLGIRLYFALLATQPVLVGIEISMYLLAFKAIGLEIHLAEATLYSCATIVGSLAGIIPGGIGVREAVAALLAEAIAQPANAAFLATAIGRIMTTGGLATITAVLAMQKRSQAPE